MSNNLVLRVAFNLINGATRPLQNIMAGSNQLAASLKTTRDKLKALDKVQKDIGAFREMRAGVSASSAQMAAAQARVASLAQAMQAAGTPTKAMTRDFEKAKQAAAQLKAAHEQQQGQLQQLRTRLSGAGIDTRNLSQHERDLRANITSTNAAMLTQQSRLTELAARERRLGEARDRMNATKATAGKMAGAGAAMAVAGAGATAALTVPVSAYAKAEDSATQLQVALMRAGATVPPEFEKINALAMKLGDRLPGTTSDFQDMMTMLNRQGISAQSILGGMGEATAYLGVQLKKAPNEAAEFAAKMQDATRTTEKDMMGLMDVIQRTFYLGVDDNNMLQGFSKLSPAMDTLKQKGLEGAKALAPLLVMADQAGMKGEAAGNAFRKIFQMSMDKKKIAKGNKELAPGKQLEFTDGKGEFGGLDNMFKQLDKLKGLTTQKRLGVLKEVFGDDAETLQAIALMMDKGVAGYSEVQGKMSAQASLQERVNKQLGTLKNLWEATTGTFTNGMVAFGESISPELKATTEWLGDMAQKMGAWARENPRMAGGIMKTAAALALLLTAGGALLLMAASILGPMAMLKFSMTTLGMQGGLLANVCRMLVAPLRAVGMAVMFIGRALIANPVGAIIMAIAVAGFLIYKYWEPIKAFFGGLWDQVKAAFAGGLGGIAALIVNFSPMGLFYQAFAGLMNWFGVSMPAKFTEFGANLIGGLVNGITNGLGAVKDAITNVATTTVTWFKDKLGIHSPSRVFGELGGFISEGAALGMENQQGKVAKAALGLAMAATATFSQAGSPIIGAQPPIDARGPLMAAQAGGAAGAGAGNTYSINITASPGMDPAAIARAVSAELDRRDRAAQTRIGSRLSD
jgi:TP901 family phage tail tape measure protein